jgi:mRNA interferase MazF
MADWNGRPILRGRVYRVELENVEGQKYYLIVSSNDRNRRLPQVLGVRLTTSPKPAIPSIVELSQTDGPFVGRAACDDIDAIWGDEIRADSGALTPRAMARIEDGLRAALGLRQPDDRAPRQP